MTDWQNDDIIHIGADELDINEFVKGEDSFVFINSTDIDSATIYDALEQQNSGLARMLRKHETAVRGQTSRPTGILAQNRYVAPDGIFDQMRMAAEAARNDDVISNAAETTEQLAFKRIEMHADDDHEASIWNQIADDIDLVGAMRTIWRELFIVSQCYPAIIWERKDYKPTTKPKANRKTRKVYKDVVVPVGITLLDPCKVIPVGNLMFGKEKLVYIADRNEHPNIDDTLAGANTSDLIVKSLFVKEYHPSQSERSLVQEAIGRSNAFAGYKLYELNPDNVWRITSTKPDYQRFADVRLRSVFEILDLKHNLREMDRADILGNTNSIILVRKGSDKQAATEPEMRDLYAQMDSLARIPIIVSDHRLEIDIISRKTDNTLRPERYNNLDSRISSRVYQTLTAGGYTSGTGLDTSLNLFKIIASTMEARRDDIRISVMKHVFYKIYEKNKKHFEDKPEMRFYPGHVSLEFNQHLATFLQDLFIQGQLSHETILAEVDISLEEEASKKRREEELYGDVFAPPSVPGAPGGLDQKSAGRTMGGNTNGGGNNLDSYNESPRTGSPNKDK